MDHERSLGTPCIVLLQARRQRDGTAVLDNNFRVRGTTNLRVVDASIFPYIPGFFIVTPTYMIAEKASEVILVNVKLF